MNVSLKGEHYSKAIISVAKVHKTIAVVLSYSYNSFGTHTCHSYGLHNEESTFCMKILDILNCILQISQNIWYTVLARLKLRIHRHAIKTSLGKTMPPLNICFHHQIHLYIVSKACWAHNMVNISCMKTGHGCKLSIIYCVKPQTDNPMMS